MARAIRTCAVVVGQRVRPEKADLARALRRRGTPQEQRLWSCLRGGALGGVRFRCQQVIAGFIVDFYCPTVGLVVEVDGRVHEHRIESDRARDLIFAGRGLRVLHLTDDQIDHDLLASLARIRTALADPV